MDNKKVLILMSTYNGEKYLSEQIESLLNQTYKNIKILIRDDGSKDNTVNIVKEFQKNHDNITLIEGKNKGFIKRAVKFFNKANNDKPVLYFSNSDYYDGNMKYLATAEKNKIYNFRNSLVECVTQGMTMIINNTTRELIKKNNPQNCLYHDWWTYMICSGFGEIIYDDKSLVKYRRHNKSVTVEGRSKKELFIWRVKKFLVGDSLKQIKKQLQEYEGLYADRLNMEDKQLLKMFTKEKYNFIIALKKTFYPKRFRRKISDEIAVRILFLFGKL